MPSLCAAQAGVALFFDADGASAACVIDRVRQPLPRPDLRSSFGVSEAVQGLTVMRVSAAAGHEPADASAATVVDEAPAAIANDIAWLLEKQCYIRAVGLRRLGLSGDEREMSRVEVPIM